MLLRPRPRRAPLTLGDDLLESLALQPVPPPQLLRDVPLPGGEPGGAQPRRHLRGRLGRSGLGQADRAARGGSERRRERGEAGGGSPLRARARPGPAAAPPHPPWRRATSGALASVRRTATATQAALPLPDAVRPPPAPPSPQPVSPGRMASREIALGTRRRSRPQAGEQALSEARRARGAPRHFVPSVQPPS